MSNQVLISGSVVRDPELKFTNNGNAVTNFTIRVITGQKRDGDEYAPSAFVDVACWNTSTGGKLAENVAQSIRDKDRVVVVGKVIQDEWEDKESGAKRTKLKVLAFEVSADLSYATVRVDQNERSGGRQQGNNTPRQQNEPSF